MDRVRPNPSLPAELQAALDRHGITVVAQAIYKWHGYRYSNASDAIAAAERGAAR